MSHATAKELFEVKLSEYALAEGYQIEYPNVTFKNLNPTKVYLSSVPMPVSTTAPSLAGSDLRTYKGIYQINITAPRGSGVSLVQKIVRDLSELFELNTPLVKGVVVVVPITPLTELPPSYEGSVTIYTVSFNYRIDVNPQEI